MVGLVPPLTGIVWTGAWESSGFPVTFREFRSNLIKGFLTAINPNGFNSRKPKTHISQLYSLVLGMNSILSFFANCCWSPSSKI